MFKEPLASQHQNKMNKKRIELEMNKAAGNVLDETQSDESFFNNLLDLCTLNKMADSYGKKEVSD